MKQQLRKLWTLVRTTYREYRRDNAAALAASIAFYAVFSVAPLLIIAAAIAGFFLGKQGADAQVAAYLGQFGTAETRDFILKLVHHWQDRSSGMVATAVGLGTLFWGACRLFMALQDALNLIWSVRPRAGLSIWERVRLRSVSFGMVVLVGLFLLASMLASAALSMVEQFFGTALPLPTSVLNVASFVVTDILLTLLFAAVFKTLPDAKVGWRDVWLGAALTALLFAVGKTFIGVYLGHTGTTSIFGAAGSLVALLFWVYFSAQIFFAGAEFTEVYARRQGRRIRPTKAAERREGAAAGDQTNA